VGESAEEGGAAAGHGGLVGAAGAGCNHTGEQQQNNVNNKIDALGGGERDVKVDENGDANTCGSSHTGAQ
jgi:hypothetical protein